MSNSASAGQPDTRDRWLIFGLGIIGAAACLCLAYSAVLFGVGSLVLNSAMGTVSSIPRSGTGAYRPPTVTPPVSGSPTDPSAAATTAAQWPALITSDFDLNTESWLAGTVNDPDFGSITRRVNGGVYAWEVDSTRDVVWYAFPEMTAASDFTVTVEARRTAGPADTSYGVILRRTAGGSYYQFDVLPDDRDFAFALYLNGDWRGVIGRTYARAINASGPNKIAVIASGPHFAFFINDQFVAAIDDSTLKAGAVGVGVWLREATKGAAFEFDNFSLRAPAPTPTITRTPTVYRSPTATRTPTITPTPQPTLALSDAGQLLFSENGGLFLINADGTGLKALTALSAGASSPSWSPDGKTIAFSRREGVDRIYFMNADGSGVTQLTDTQVNETAPAWSPDGQQIAYVSDENGQTDIYIMNRDGSGRVRVTTNVDDDSEPAWFPGGGRLAFVVYELNTYELALINTDGAEQRRVDIYIMKADGSQPTRVTNTFEAERGPDWRP